MTSFVPASTPLMLSCDGLSNIRSSVPSLVFDQIEPLEPAAKRHTVYNFEVEGAHTYIAGGYRVHNTSALDFWDEDQHGEITGITFDANGYPIVTSETTDGGVWTISTGVADQDGTVVSNEQFNWESQNGRYNFERTVTKDRDGNVTNMEINDSDYHLIGDELGSSGAKLATPFILDAIGADSTFERLVGGTLINAVLQNIIESALNPLQLATSLNDTNLNGGVLEEVAFDAWEDFGLDFAQAGVDSILSLTSSAIMSEIFGEWQPDTFGEEVMVRLTSAGVSSILEAGLDVALGDSLVGDLVDSPFVDIPGNQTFAGVAGTMIANVIFGAVLDEVLPSPETQEGQIAEAATNLIAAALLPFTGFAGIAISKFIGALVGQLIDDWLGTYPEAFAEIEFNDATGVWAVTGIDTKHGAGPEFAEQLGDAVLGQLNVFQEALQTTSNNFDNLEFEIGHIGDDIVGVKRGPQPNGPTIFDYMEAIANGEEVELPTSKDRLAEKKMSVVV